MGGVIVLLQQWITIIFGRDFRGFSIIMLYNVTHVRIMCVRESSKQKLLVRSNFTDHKLHQCHQTVNFCLQGNRSSSCVEHPRRGRMIPLRSETSLPTSGVSPNIIACWRHDSANTRFPTCVRFNFYKCGLKGSCHDIRWRWSKVHRLALWEPK